jgi:ABC-type transport system involved in cytochrome c biogenesis permease subunit
VSPLEPEVPPTSEEVHLPGPSVLPLLTAVGITLAVVGVTTSLILVIGGAVLTIACVLRWIGDTRRDIDELPLDHH